MASGVIVNLQSAIHRRATCPSVGSAQQYQGSVRYGTVARAARGWS